MRSRDLAVVVALSLSALNCGDPGPRIPADITLSVSSAEFAATSGGANPATVFIQISNSGDEPLTGLRAVVAYGAGQPEGWLTASLSAMSAPSALTLSAVTGSLRGGDYTGTVTISSPDAAHGAVVINVTFNVARAAPAAPSNLDAVVGTQGSILLSWTDNSLIEDGFRIERCAGAACTDFAYVTGVGENVRDYTHTGNTTPDVTYRYRVQAVNAEGLSDFSNVADVTTPRLPAIVLDQESVHLSSPQGSPGSSRVIVAVTNGGDGTLANLVVQPIAYGPEPRGGDWLVATLDRTTAPAVLTIDAFPANLAAGTYTATVSLSAAGASNSPQTVAVTFQILRPDLVITSPAALTVSPQAIHAGGSVTFPAITVKNRGETHASQVLVAFLLSPDAELTRSDRLLIQYSSGRLSVNEALEVPAMTVTVPAEVADGEYTIGVLVDPDDVLRELHEDNNALSTSFVVGPPPTIALEPRELAFAATTGGVDPARQTVAITNSGGRTLSGLEISRIEGGGDWLTMELESTAAPTELEIGAQTGSLAPGRYTATLWISAPGATNSPQPVVATFDVAPEGVPPAAPTNVRVTQAFSNAITIAWDDNSDDEDGFRIEKCAGAGCNTFAEVGRWPANATTYSDGMIAPATSYSYRVRAYSAGGNSHYSNVITVTTPAADGPPAPATGLSATAVSATEVALSWTDNSLNEYDFFIERCAGADCSDFFRVASVTTNVTSYRDVGLASATSYSYRVLAWNGIGTPGSSNIATVVTPAVAAIELAPATVSFSATSGGASPAAQTVAVSNSGSGVLDRLSVGLIEYGVGQSTGWLAAALDRATAPATLSMAPTTGALLPGSYSAKVNIESPAATNSPQIVTVVFEVAAARPDLKVSGANGAPFSITPTTVPQGQSVAFSSFFVKNVGTVASTQYHVGIYVSTAPQLTDNKMLLAEATFDGLVAGDSIVVSNAGTYIPPEVAPGSYYIGILVDGPGAISEADESNNYLSAPITVTPGVVPPAAPTGLSATVTGLSVTLRWTDNASNEDGFRVERCVGSCLNIPGSPATYTVVATLVPDATTLTSSNHTAGTTYHYRIRAYNSVGSSPASNTVTFVAGMPNAPTNLVATGASASAIGLTWTDNATFETGYEISRCSGAGCTNFTVVTTIGADATSYQDGGLGETTEYRYRVRALSATGNSSYSNIASATTLPATSAPAAPNGLVATVISGNLIELAWADNASNESGFKVERCTGAGCSAFVEVAVTAANVTSFQNSGLAGSTVYRYRVRAYNSVGPSAFTPAVSATTLPVPAAPSNLVATVISSAEIRLTWTDNATDETGFRIQRCEGATCTNFTDRASPVANATSYSDGSVSPNRTYRYRMFALNANGASASSNEVSAATPPLERPTGLSAAAPSSGRIRLTWTNNAPVFGVSSVEVHRCAGLGCSNFALVAEVDPTAMGSVQTYDDVGLTQATLYLYRLRATQAASQSAFSDIATTATGHTPAAPTNLSGSSPSSSSISLAWEDKSHNETGFRVERCTGVGCTTFSQVALVAANTSTYTNTGLSSATTYRYRVRATDGDNNSGPTNELTINTQQAAGTPVAPSNLGATAMSSAQIDLAWTDNASNETGYIVERCSGAGCTNFSVIANAAGTNVSNYASTGLLPETSYSYRVRYFNAAGNSVYSNTATALTPPLAAPSNVVATAISATQINLSWVDNSVNETNFLVERCSGAGCTAFTQIASLAVGTTTYVNAPVTSGTSYSYRVRASNGTFRSPYSNTATATTP